MIFVAIGEKTERLYFHQACFVVAHSSGDFIVKNFRTVVYILNINLHKDNTLIVTYTYIYIYIYIYIHTHTCIDIYTVQND